MNAPQSQRTLLQSRHILPCTRSGHLGTIELLALAVVLVAGALAGGCSQSGTGGATGASGSASGGGTGGAPVGHASPAPASPIQAQLAHAVYLNIWGLGVQHLDTVYDAQHASATVAITLEGTIPNTELKAQTAQALTKALCLMAHQALWTSQAQLNEATVTVFGPMQDEYADTIVDAYGVAVVEKGTAAKVTWTTVSAESAWQDYDRVFLRGSFELVD